MDTKKTIIGLIIIIIGVIGFSIYSSIKKPTQTIVAEKQNIKNISYIINREPITLIDGVATTDTAPGSASKTVTRYFGNELISDVNGDGLADTTFLITQETGGSGVFYYVVSALKTNTGYKGGVALFLGDRIAPQTTEKAQNTTNKNIIVVNYADRKPGESFAVQPSVGKSLFLLLDPVTLQFGEVVQNFEGEADPSRMSLSMQQWKWIKTQYNNDTTVTPKTAGKFTLTLKKDKTFSATTDCNSIGGNYTVNGNSIAFSNMISTLMFCEGSQESAYSKMLGQIQSFQFTSKGELIMSLKMDSGEMYFK